MTRRTYAASLARAPQRSASEVGTAKASARATACRWARHFALASSVVALTMIGCTTLATAESPSSHTADAAKGTPVSETILTRADNGKTVDVRVGERLVVRLEESPTTGFVWSLKSKTDNLLLLESDYAPAPAGAIGGSGHRTLTFIAQKPGAASLQLKLWRDWEGESSEVEVFTANTRILARE